MDYMGPISVSVFVIGTIAGAFLLWWVDRLKARFGSDFHEKANPKTLATMGRA